jgi:hypothetical protein
LEKVAQNTEISTSKINLKVQNIHIKLLLKPLNKPWVETEIVWVKIGYVESSLNGEISPESDHVVHTCIVHSGFFHRNKCCHTKALKINPSMVTKTIEFHHNVVVPSSLEGGWSF